MVVLQGSSFATWPLIQWLNHGPSFDSTALLLPSLDALLWQSDWLSVVWAQRTNYASCYLCIECSIVHVGFKEVICIRVKQHLLSNCLFIAWYNLLWWSSMCILGLLLNPGNAPLTRGAPLPASHYEFFRLQIANDMIFLRVVLRKAILLLRYDFLKLLALITLSGKTTAFTIFVSEAFLVRGCVVCATPHITWRLQLFLVVHDACVWWLWHWCTDTLLV